MTLTLAIVRVMAGLRPSEPIAQHAAAAAAGVFASPGVNLRVCLRLLHLCCWPTVCSRSRCLLRGAG